MIPLPFPLRLNDSDQPMSPTEERILRLVEYASKVVSVVGYVAGPVCVVLAIGLVLFCTYMFFVVVLPYHHTPVVSFGWWLHACFALYWTFNIFFNYYYGVTTSPGYSPDVRE